MKRRKPLSRRTPLRRTILRARPKQPASGDESRLRREERELAEAWVAGVRGKRCAACGRPPGSGVRIQGHHVIRQQRLRRIAADRGLDPVTLLWDPRCLLALCEDCHMRHHSRARPIPMRVLVRHAPASVAMAYELGVLDQLKAEYP